MAKIRALKPETWTDSKFVRLSPLARLLFLGMWNLACDNGHLDDDAIELKIRLLPVDACDVEDLVAELVATGQVERHDGFLKVPRLPDHQRPDLRYLALCEHCERDADKAFTPDDRKFRPAGTRRAPAGHTTGTQSVPATDGDGDGDGDKKTSSSRAASAAATTKSKDRGTRIPDPFPVTPRMVQWARAEAPGLDHRAVTARFVDYWRAIPGQKGVKLDWEATWRNWMRRELENARPETPRPGTSVWDKQVVIPDDEPPAATNVDWRSLVPGGEGA